MTEPWISGTHPDVDPLLRPVLHCFDHAKSDLAQWTEGLSVEQLWARPLGLGPVGFHIRHIAGSCERLFTYARGGELTDEQMDAMRSEEKIAGLSREELLDQLAGSLDAIADAVHRLDVKTLGEARAVGRKRLPTTVAGLLVHMAEHTQRHVGEAIVTAKVVRAAVAG